MKHQFLGFGLIVLSSVVSAEDGCDQQRVYSYIKEGLSHSDIELICSRGNPAANKCCCTTVRERQSNKRVYSTERPSNDQEWIIVHSTYQEMPKKYCEGVRYDNEFFRTRSYCSPLAHCEL